ncbi:glycosyltransferase family 117 protein [Flavobacterium silvaticum]|uniref:DUF2723 domain-containing protein n=1 Tax=Flavobacterium silvaticum TaxID=1852020 RepID=A0A972JGN9_9FLAO|nr:DUF2723 domain-containing protein [Flavobacterium silvaticum]NMH27075.1 DUF2723 domain-containing protein [Flavobacterium silvaticum]
MADFNSQKWDKWLGWLAFSIAFIVYFITVEPTMSFWDCGEYIATAANLEVGHPPGAPLFQMLGAFLSIFAVGKEHIALMVNMISVLSSAFTILLLFWSSTMVLRKVVASYSELTPDNQKMILGASFVGALTFTFSDSFWFNAVEAEVYAMASFLIALLFWLGLKWEQNMDSERGNRWLLLISMVIGLSYGVHFMALLTIPSIGLLYFFKKRKTITIKNFIFGNIVIVGILVVVALFLMPWTMGFFGKSEIFFVNSLGLPFNSGTIFAFAAMIAVFYFGLKYTRRKGKVLANTILLCIMFLFIGFSTWMMLPIRANANPPINENKPSDAAELLAYYNREQYGVNPLFYGPQYTDMFAGLDKDNPYLDKAPNYERDYKTGKYVITNNWKNAEQNSDDNHKAFLPRMWSTEHAENYMNFTKVPDFRINPEYAEEQELVSIVSEFRKAYSTGQIDSDGYVKFLKAYGEYLIIDKPTTGENLGFMFEYQFGYMYWRYLMWNFTGRQNDIQGKYDNLDGNWLSGITAVDEMHLGSQQHLPDDTLNNKGRNLYFFLPFVLGLIGLAYHANKDLKSFYILLALFLFTGLALKIYLNERPFEPRERDYALVGSFYVFAIWVGFGAYAVYDWLLKKVQAKILIPVITAVTLLASPILMASQNWDDHDRSNRYTAIAMAKNYLNSCDKDAILFTIGDNDTFPLWYAQEIEGVRRDVKIVCTSLFMTDWYIDEMKMKSYESDGVPVSFKHEQYVGDKLDYAVYQQTTDGRLELGQFLNFLKLEDPRALVEMNNGIKYHFYPTNKVRIPVDKNAVIANKVVNPKLYDSIVPYIDIEIKGPAIYKNRIMMLDILQNNNWKRPIYFTGGSFGDDDYLWMKDYLQLDGVVFKLVPIKTPIKDAPSPLDMGMIDSDKMYNLVTKWDWGNGESTKIYHDPETRKNSITYRTNMARLMEQLINEGQTAKAKEIIKLALEKMPLDYYGYYTMVEPFAGGYYALNETTKARELLEKLMKKYQQNLTFYKGMSSRDQSNIAIDIVSDIERYRGLLEVMKDHKDTEFYNKNKAVFNEYNNKFKRFGRDPE